MKLTRLALFLALALGLVGGGFATIDIALAESCVSHCDDSKKHDDDGGGEAEPLVRITGGTVSNSTTIDISVDGGTAIGDASGGDNNFAFASGDDDDGGDVASAGNGGTATASANGGAVSVGNVNSGGNAGNSIAVGNTSAHGGDCKDCPKHDDCKDCPKPDDCKDCAKPHDCKDCGSKKPVCCDKPDAPKGGSKGGVKALPSTGSGSVAGESNALMLLTVVGALGAAGYGLRRRFV